MSRLIVDVTELSNWQGKLTGVPRVINELSIRFSKDKSVIFVSWDSRRRKFNILDVASLGFSSLETGYDNNLKTKAKTRNTTETLKQLIRKSSMASKITEITIRDIRYLKTIKFGGNYNSSSLSFRHNDVLLMMSDWHGSDINFINALKEAQSNGVDLIQLVYDMLPIIAPQYSGHATAYLSRYVKAIFPLCKLLIAISEQTKIDIQKWLKNNNLVPPDIAVIRLGDDFKVARPVKPSDPSFKKLNIEGNDYILCVGTIEARKNHMLLYYVYKLAHSRGIQLPKLLIVGRTGWHSENAYDLLTKDSEVNNRILILQNINDNELSWLYRHTLFSIYPSFYEGWGLPIAESMLHRKVCISSNTSSIPEIAGKLIEYFNPTSTEECLDLIIKLMNPRNLEKANNKILKYKITTWDTTFQTLRSIMDKYE